MSRSVWKGPFVDPSLIKKVEKLKTQTNQKHLITVLTGKRNKLETMLSTNLKRSINELKGKKEMISQHLKDQLMQLYCHV